MVRKGGFLCFNAELDSILCICDKLTNDGKFGIPKGHQEDNETIGECAKRELYEETGLVYYPRGTTTAMPERMMRLGDTSLYVVRIHSCDRPFIHDTKEVARVLWVPVSQLYVRDCNRVLRQVLEKITVAKRIANEQDGVLKRPRNY